MNYVTAKVMPVRRIAIFCLLWHAVHLRELIIYPVAEEIAEATGQVVPQYYLTSEMEPVYRDMRASIKYWNSIDDEVDLIYEKLGIHITEVSNATNDAFLRSNGETGVSSYQVPDSIYVRFYLTYIGED